MLAVLVVVHLSTTVLYYKSILRCYEYILLESNEEIFKCLPETGFELTPSRSIVHCLHRAAMLTPSYSATDCKTPRVECHPL